LKQSDISLLLRLHIVNTDFSSILQLNDVMMPYMWVMHLHCVYQSL